MAAEGSNENGRISVSEDKLYRALSEFELRLKTFIDEKLERKADLLMLNEARKTIQKQAERLDALEAWRNNQRAIALSWKQALMAVAFMVSAAWWLPDLFRQISH